MPRRGWVFAVFLCQSERIAVASTTHSCDSCGLVMDRDHNAAVNIRQRGIETLPVECREVTPPESMPLAVAQCHGQASSLNEEANDFSRW